MSDYLDLVVERSRMRAGGTLLTLTDRDYRPSEEELELAESTGESPNPVVEYELPFAYQFAKGDVFEFYHGCYGGATSPHKIDGFVSLRVLRDFSTVFNLDIGTIQSMQKARDELLHPDREDLGDWFAAERVITSR